MKIPYIKLNLEIQLFNCVSDIRTIENDIKNKVKEFLIKDLNCEYNSDVEIEIELVESAGNG